jgi:hypothetical protein
MGTAMADEKPPPEFMSALVGALAIKAPVAASTAAGVIVGLALLALGLRYEHRRLMPVVLTSPGTTAITTTTRN